MQKIKANNITAVLVLIALFIMEYVFFRNIIFKDALVSNSVDGELNILFCEHWYKVFQGKEVWTELNIFYPASNVLSYSDIMLGFGIPYSILRVMGFSKYIAFEIIVVAFHFIGSIVMYLLSKKIWKMNTLISVLMVVIFSFSDGYAYLSGNPQMFVFSWLPLLLLLASLYIKQINYPKRYKYAIGIILLVAMMFYTAFYVGYFTLMLLFLAVIIFLIMSFFLRKQECIRNIYMVIWSKKHEFIVYILLFILLMIPFIKLYLPTFMAGGGRTWQETLMYMPKIEALFNIEGDNPLGLEPTNFNMNLGFPMVELILLFIIIVLDIIIDVKRNAIIDIWLILKYGILIVCVVGFLMGVKIDDKYSLWYIFWKVLPGTSGIRAVARWTPFMMLPLAIYIGLVLKNKINKTWHKIVAIISIVVIYLLNMSNFGVTSAWEESKQIAFEQNLEDPPQDCECFYVVNPNLDDIAFFDKYPERYAMLAFDIAEIYDLKTLNGYSGQNPEGWDLNVFDEEYERKVDEWVTLNNIDEDVLYKYDLTDNKWIKYGL